MALGRCLSESSADEISFGPDCLHTHTHARARGMHEIYFVYSAHDQCLVINRLPSFKLTHKLEHTRNAKRTDEQKRAHTINNAVCKLYSMKTKLNSLHKPCGLQTKSLIKQ